MKKIKEFVEECGLDYNKNINKIWPSEEFLYVNKKHKVHILDYLGVGK